MYSVLLKHVTTDNRWQYVIDSVSGVNLKYKNINRAKVQVLCCIFLNFVYYIAKMFKVWVSKHSYPVFFPTLCFRLPFSLLRRKRKIEK